jgi:hypothetical protein
MAKISAVIRRKKTKTRLNFLTENPDCNFFSVYLALSIKFSRQRNETNTAAISATGDRVLSKVNLILLLCGLEIQQRMKMKLSYFGTVSDYREMSYNLKYQVSFSNLKNKYFAGWCAEVV